MSEIVRLIANCRICGMLETAVVKKSEYERWQSGEYIQDVWPDMDADSREMFISKTCRTCFDAMFPPDEMDP